jgi:phosphoesterase RecJ-like protein
MLDWTSVTKAVQHAAHILVVSHINPDGDAIGSTLAVHRIVESFGKPVTLVNESPIPAKYAFLPGADEIQSASHMNEQFATVIAVDAADISRIGNCQQLFADDATIINIDHHGTNDHFGTINVIQPDAAATVELLYDWVQQSNIPLTSELATVLYAGLLTDTGGFRYSNTSPKVLRIAAELMEHGAPAADLADRLLETISLDYVQQLKNALDTIQFACNGKVAYLLSDAEDNDGLVNVARNIEGVDVGVLFRPRDEEHVKVSLRSRQFIDVSAIAQSLGGGGHIRAAGCTIKGSCNEVVNIVIKKLEEAFKDVGE